MIRRLRRRYERAGEPLAPRSTFFRRLGSNLALALLLIAVSLFVGMVGYHGLAKLAWIDAFLNASMILSGMGPVDPLPTSGAKVFAGVYALYSGLTLVATAGLILAPVLHRALHWFHIMEEGADSAQGDGGGPRDPSGRAWPPGTLARAVPGGTLLAAERHVVRQSGLRNLEPSHPPR